jgi:ABC-type transport system involved in cytochrome c biogenesis permease subunit
MRGWPLILVALAATAAVAQPKLPTAIDVNAIRDLPVQHDGRWPPLDTLARDMVETVTGRSEPDGHDPVLLLLAWTFDADAWRNQPVIPIANAELRRELQLDPTRTKFSFTELVNHAPLRRLIDALGRRGGGKLDPLETKVSDISEKLTLLDSIFGGDCILVIPHPSDPGGAWRPVSAPAKGATESGGEVSVRAAWADLRTAFRANDGAGFASATQRLKAALQALPAAHRPDPRLLATELRYNLLHPFRVAWVVMLVGAALATAALWIRRRWFDGLAVAGMLAGFAVLSYGLWLRWEIAGRIPATDMFESLLFLSWGMGAFAILAMLVQRARVVPLTASTMGAVALILADVLPLDHFIRPAVPVLLDTVWMSIHVPIIMVSYSVLALAMLIAHVQLATMALVPRRRELITAIDRLHYWYLHVGSILLFVGIVTGSMWAAASWGRYWAWDPKEVWSLAAFLGYMAILHVRADHEHTPGWLYGLAVVLGLAVFAAALAPLAPLTAAKIVVAGGAAAVIALFVLLRGMFATALKSALAFWLIIMLYVGVNYVLGIGLHSYGFGTGAVVKYLSRVAGIDLGLVVLCCIVYLARRPATPPPTSEAPATP